MDQRVVHRADVEVLFLEEFNVTEREEILNILRMLGRMIILDTESLFKFYEIKYQKKLKLKYVKLAVKNGLLIEYKKNYQTEAEENKFFYTLKSGGKYALEAVGARQFTHSIAFSRDRYNNMLEYNYSLLNSAKLFFSFWNMKVEEFGDFVREIINETYDYNSKPDYFGAYTVAIHPKYT